MKAFDIQSIEIVSLPKSPLPVSTATGHLAAWLRQASGVDLRVNTTLRALAYLVAPN